MARPQNRYLVGNSTAAGAGSGLNTELQFDDAVNVHGLRVDINIESEAMEANSNGYWIVYALPGDTIGGLDLPTSYSDLDNEDLQGYIWGIGNWMASNQTPFHHVFMPKTSRNLPRKGRVFCQVRVIGTLPIATNNRINTIISAFANP